MTLRLVSALAVAVLGLACPSLHAAGSDVVGQKLDSGLGSLPHYAHWADHTGRQVAHVAGESLDDGLGDLAPYALWIDRQGHVATHVAGESLDDGLGALPHYSLWIDRSGHDPMGTATSAAKLASR